MPSSSDLQTRLRRVEGQVQGVQRMLAEDRGCEDVLTQLLAVRSAVGQVCLLMTEQHVRECVFGGELEADDPRLREVTAALKLLVRSGA